MIGRLQARGARPGGVSLHPRETDCGPWGGPILLGPEPSGLRTGRESRQWCLGGAQAGPMA